MGSSTIKLSQVLDTLAAKAIPDPRNDPSGYGDQMVVDLATQVMADITCERFNWKWNRANATPFLTNSWQQDYPQLAQPGGIVGWGEDCDAIDILNTSMPKPGKSISWRRGLSRAFALAGWWPNNICWMYNRDLYIGQWPGPGVVYSPLNVSPQAQNPLMSMTDVNGNILIVTTTGTTFNGATLDVTHIVVTAASGATPILATLTYSGAALNLSQGLLTTLSGLTTYPSLNGQILPVYSAGTNTLTFALTSGATQASAAETGTMAVAAAAPQLPAGAAEGLTVGDGTVVWTCVSPTSPGFRIDRLPPATGPTLLIKPYYQIEPRIFTELTQTLDPMPDSFSRFFYRGMESQLLIASPNPGDLKRGQMAEANWRMAMNEAMKQGDRETNIYGLIPAQPVVQQRWDERRPYTADDPY